jgi:CO/xanthine dehydrogenase Mo-binding subunit
VTTQFVQIPTAGAGPRGAKGLAEAPNVATAAAISNAIAQLVGRPVRQLPMTAERVWEVLEEDDT